MADEDKSFSTYSYGHVDDSLSDYQPITHKEGLVYNGHIIGLTIDSDDMVNNPPHYKGHSRFGYPCVETIRQISSSLTDAEYRGYCKGNALKYISRERTKNGDQDLEKARWYLDEILGAHAAPEPSNTSDEKGD